MVPGGVAFAVVWSAIGLAVCAGATTYGLGSLGQPQPGLFPFVVGAGIVLLATSEAIACWRAHAPSTRLRLGEHGSAVIVALAILCLYALAFERLGFAVCTLLLFVALFRALAGRGWRFSVAAGLLATVVFYVAFEYGLKVNLPRGPWGF
ncbi:MAG: tripartite tricarboxylate transporter TctB family protein [Alphaproteobacteria bacterium]|nr:tripartite tricarboxylate transporter TctB family protein [Alphaproteobacteria bacterium]